MKHSTLAILGLRRLQIPSIQRRCPEMKERSRDACPVALFEVDQKGSLVEHLGPHTLSLLQRQRPQMIEEEGDLASAAEQPVEIEALLIHGLRGGRVALGLRDLRRPS